MELDLRATNVTIIRFSSGIRVVQELGVNQLTATTDFKMESGICYIIQFDQFRE